MAHTHSFFPPVMEAWTIVIDGASDRVPIRAVVWLVMACAAVVVASRFEVPYLGHKNDAVDFADFQRRRIAKRKNDAATTLALIPFVVFMILACSAFLQWAMFHKNKAEAIRRDTAHAAYIECKRVNPHPTCSDADPRFNIAIQNCHHCGDSWLNVMTVHQPTFTVLHPPMISNGTRVP